jgi:predicted nucleotidyltransferase
MPTPGEILIEAARRVLEADARIAYALVFGSAAREDGRPARDLDLAVGLTRGTRLSVRDLGDLLSRLEKAAGKPVDFSIEEGITPLLQALKADAEVKVRVAAADALSSYRRDTLERAGQGIEKFQ